MAKLVGPTATVWSFEPAPQTADYLEASIALNEFSNVQVERCAVSSSSCTAQFSTSSHYSELNSIVHAGSEAAATMGKIETVQTISMDEAMDWLATHRLSEDRRCEPAHVDPITITGAKFSNNEPRNDVGF